MSETAYISAEIDAEIIDAANLALKDTGFTLVDAIRLMIVKTARDKCLPFDAEAALEEEYREKIPNTLTRETMEKVRKGEGLHKAKDLNDLIQQLEA